jgi:hypothetical protein
MGKKSKNGGSRRDEKKDASFLAFPPHLLSTDPPSKLAYQQPKELSKKRIWVLEKFFSPAECQVWIDFIEGCKLDHVKQRGTRYLAARECYRCSLEDAVMSQRLFERLKTTKLMEVIPDSDRLITCNPNLRLYKYETGHMFGPHIDESNELAVGVTRLTVLIYLSECQGGATRFEKSTTFEPVTGAILLHVHGDDCLEHEADAVTAGIKYVLRTDLVYTR